MNTYKVTFIGNAGSENVTAQTMERNGTTIDFYTDEKLVATIPLNNVLIVVKE